MADNYVKLFEELDQEGALDREEQEDPEKQNDSEEFIISNEIDTSKLSSGQKAALEREDALLTPAQYAACYVRAKNAIANAEDTRGYGDTTLTRTAKNLAFAKDKEDWKTAPTDKLGFYMGRSPSTISRTVSSFRKMLEGEREYSNTNRIYKMALEYFDKFESMPYADVVNGAELAITETPNDEEWEKYRAEKAGASATSVAKKAASLSTVRRELRKSFLQLKNQGKSIEEAVRLAVNSQSQFLKVDKAAVAKEGMIEFKDESFIKEAFRKLYKKLQ